IDDVTRLAAAARDLPALAGQPEPVGRPAKLCRLSTAETAVRVGVRLATPAVGMPPAGNPAALDLVLDREFGQDCLAVPTNAGSFWVPLVGILGQMHGLAHSGAKEEMAQRNLPVPAGKTVQRVATLDRCRLLNREPGRVMPAGAAIEQRL